MPPLCEFKKYHIKQHYCNRKYSDLQVINNMKMLFSVLKRCGNFGKLVFVGLFENLSKTGG